jgi:hypothetical protein
MRAAMFIPGFATITSLAMMVRAKASIKCRKRFSKWGKVIKVLGTFTTTSRYL